MDSRNRKTVDLKFIFDDQVRTVVLLKTLGKYANLEKTPSRKINDDQTPTSDSEMRDETFIKKEIRSTEKRTPRLLKRESIRLKKGKRSTPSTPQTPKNMTTRNLFNTPVIAKRRHSLSIKDTENSTPRRSGLRSEGRKSVIGLYSKISENLEDTTLKSTPNQRILKRRFFNSIKGRTYSFQKNTFETENKYQKKTPCSIKQKSKNGTLKITTESESDLASSSEPSDLDSSEEYTPTEDSSDSDSEKDSNSYSNTPMKQPRWTPRVERRLISRLNFSARRRILDIDYDNDTTNLDEYFCNKRTPTGKKTMGQFKNFSFKYKELTKIFEENDTYHEKEISELYTHYVSKFEMWLVYLKQGFSLLLYGLGSKVELIDDFQTQMLADYHILSVKGFFPGLTMKKILNSLVKGIFNESTCPANNEEALMKIETLSIQKKFPIFLVIHNVDGPALRCMKTQSVLSKLSVLPNIHLIVTMDHINAPILLSNRTFSRFNFIAQVVHTFKTYIYETHSTGEFQMHASMNDDLSKLKKIVALSTMKTKKIFKMILEDHVKHKDDKMYQGIFFEELMKRARQAMLVTNTSELQENLRAFYGHDILKKTNNFLHIPMRISTITQFFTDYFRAV